MEITTVGIDMAKSVFQVHAVDQHGKVVLKKQIKARPDGGIFRESTNVPDRNGSLHQRSLLGTEAADVRE